jgi:hypothetical protein
MGHLRHEDGLGPYSLRAEAVRIDGPRREHTRRHARHRRTRALQANSQQPITERIDAIGLPDGTGLHDDAVCGAAALAINK